MCLIVVCNVTSQLYP